MLRHVGPSDVRLFSIPYLSASHSFVPTGKIKTDEIDLTLKTSEIAPDEQRRWCICYAGEIGTAGEY